MGFYVEEYKANQHFNKVVGMEMTPMAIQEGNAIGYPFMDAKRVLVLHLELSASAYVMMDTETDELLGAFGLMKGLSSNAVIGHPWLTHNGFLGKSKHNVSFLRRSREIIKGWLSTEHIKTLETDVLGDNKASITWLKWLGFTMGHSKSINGETFYHCVKHK